MSPESRESSFDELARGLASGTVSRRKALKWMGAALLGGALASGPSVAQAAPFSPGFERCGRDWTTRTTRCCDTSSQFCSGRGQGKHCRPLACTAADGGTCGGSDQCSCQNTTIPGTSFLTPICVNTASIRYTLSGACAECSANEVCLFERDACPGPGRFPTHILCATACSA